MYISWNKETYKGEFKDSLRHGKGTLTDANGIVTIAYWKNGGVVIGPEPNLLTRAESCSVF